MIGKEIQIPSVQNVKLDDGSYVTVLPVNTSNEVLIDNSSNVISLTQALDIRKTQIGVDENNKPIYDIEMIIDGGGA